MSVRELRPTIAFIAMLLILGVPARVGHAQQPDPVIPLLSQLTSANLAQREASFYALLSLAPTTTPGAVNAIPGQLAGLLAAFPNDAPQVVTGLSGLLAFENTDLSLGADLVATSEDETDSDFYLDLVETVVELHDPATIPSLAGAIASGGMATTALAAFGKGALAPVLVLTYSPHVQVRHAAGVTLITMLSPQFHPLFDDQTSLSMIRAGLTHIVATFDPPSPYSYLQTPFNTALTSMGPGVTGDLDGDGAADCTDRQFVIAALGARLGQPGFDIRADVNGDGVITGVDVGMEASTLKGKNMSCE